LNVGDALRPQLDIISGHSHALQLDAEAALAPRVLRHLDKLRQAAQRVGKLFEDLSRLIRDQAAEAGAGRDAARPRGVDLDVVARHAITLHEAQARDSGVILRHVAWPEPVRADAELSAVLQVISELLANGIAFNLRDATLTLETSVRDGRACLAFIDEGLGLSESQRARLFDPLAQPAPADPGRDADRGGLGLVIARAMACAMGGEIRVASRPGAGSMFTLELTLQHAPFAARGGAAQPGPETQADASTST
jgi:signal transduction histidine kinase